jgi:hypothetical protein
VTPVTPESPDGEPKPYSVATGPVEPLTPVAPLTPVEPVGPDTPETPVAPETPEAPLTPVAVTSSALTLDDTAERVARWATLSVPEAGGDTTVVLTGELAIAGTVSVDPTDVTTSPMRSWFTRDDCDVISFAAVAGDCNGYEPSDVAVNETPVAATSAPVTSNWKSTLKSVGTPFRSTVR